MTPSDLIEILFPKVCLCCRESRNALLCAPCLDCLPHKKSHQCPHCQDAITPNGAVCSSCYGLSPLEGVFSVAPYSHPTIKAILFAYKYRFAVELSAPLGAFLTEGLFAHDIALPDILIPVPLHARRLRWRGFNQSALLASELSLKLLPGTTLPISQMLTRSRFTPPQAKADTRATRLENLKNAFAWEGDGGAIEGKRIWLVDDVATTGSTLAECAKTLKSAGAREVWGVTLAG